MRDKKRLVSLLAIALLLVFIGVITYLKFNFKEKIDINIVYSDSLVEIENYYIYGTFFNFTGRVELDNKPQNVRLLLHSTKSNINIPIEWNYEDGLLSFYTNKYVNSGLYLENINQGEYEVILEVEGEKRLYHSLKNITKDGDFEYYTLTKNKKNNKIDIMWKEEHLHIVVKRTALPSHIYDIVLDPGHTGSDSGAIGVVDNMEYYERDLNLLIAKSLKEQLEKRGFKVAMTRNDNETKVGVYEKGGSAVLGNEVFAKYNFAIHNNSSEKLNEYEGLEIYALDNIDYTLARFLVRNIIDQANTVPSNKNIFYQESGIYVRNFTEKQIAENIIYAKKEGYEPEIITTDTPYYYNLREMGGRLTGAFTDGRDPNVLGVNPYVDSIHVCESYLLELGYMNNVNDLKNLVKNYDLYAKGIASGLDAYLSNLESK